MDNKYLLISHLSITDFQEEEIWSNQWTVGTFNTLEEVKSAADEDLNKTLVDAFKYNETDNDDLIKEIFEEREVINKEASDLIKYDTTVILSAEFNVSKYNRQIIDYMVIKI